MDCNQHSCPECTSAGCVWGRLFRGGGQCAAKLIELSRRAIHFAFRPEDCQPSEPTTPAARTAPTSSYDPSTMSTPNTTNAGLVGGMAMLGFGLGMGVAAGLAYLAWKRRQPEVVYVRPDLAPFGVLYADQPPHEQMPIINAAGQIIQPVQVQDQEIEVPPAPQQPAGVPVLPPAAFPLPEEEAEEYHDAQEPQVVIELTDDEDDEPGMLMRSGRQLRRRRN